MVTTNAARLRAAARADQRKLSVRERQFIDAVRGAAGPKRAKTRASGVQTWRCTAVRNWKQVQFSIFKAPIPPPKFTFAAQIHFCGIFCGGK